MTESGWAPCFTDPELGIAFFDGVTIRADSIMDPRWDRVLTILQEEQVLMCRWMAPLLAKHPNALVLDVGTGSGVFAICAARQGCRVVAVDINPRALLLARYNARENGIPTVENEHDLVAGSILFRSTRFDASFADDHGERFDMVFLAPPYNPTCEGVLPPLHAEAGEDGQRAFVEQIQFVPRVLRPGGHCIGNQMTTSGPSGELEIFQQIRDSFGVGAGIRYSMMLDGTYPVSSFLGEQYRTYLFDARPPGQDVVRAYISRVSGKWASFALVYYEVTKAGLEGVEHEQQTAISEVEFGARPPFDWSCRTWLHRCIVDHSSSANSIPSTALFMNRPAIAALPRRSTDLHVHLDAETAWENSPLKAVGDWIEAEELMKKFDTILIDTAPWYQLYEGSAKLREECKVWLAKHDPDLALRLLAKWQHNTRSLQSTRLGPFLHPHFTGKSDPDEWRGTQYSILCGSQSPGLESPEEEVLFAEMLSAVEAKFPQGKHSVNPDELREQLRSEGFAFVENGYSFADLENLEVPSPSQYYHAMEQRLSGLATTDDRQRVRRDLERRDLELCHLVMHVRIRELFQPDLGNGSRWSVLLGLPLALSFASGSREEAAVPETYRGGLWLYAASREAWSPRHERLLFDLSRLLWVFYNGRYNHDAAANLPLIVYMRLASTFSHELRQIADSLSQAWTVSPSDHVREAVRAAAPEADWAGRDWKVMPLPTLLDAVGTTLRVWCQLEQPRGFFSDFGLPQTLHELFLTCWRMSKAMITPRVARIYNLETELDRAETALEQIDSLWGDGFQVAVSGNPPIPDWREPQADAWMRLARVLVLVFTECIRNADPSRPIQVEVVWDRDLKVVVRDFKDPGEDGGKQILSELDSVRRHRPDYSAWLRDFHGDQILRHMLRMLKGDCSRTETQEEFELRIRIPSTEFV